MKPVFSKADKYQKKQGPQVNDAKKDMLPIKEYFKNIENMKEF